MKYAVLSDIHGNLPALEAVLQDARDRGAEGYLLLGDYCLSLPWPDRCLSRILGLKNATIIRGNEEGYLERLEGMDPAGWTDGQMQISYWGYRNLSPENRKRLLAMPQATTLCCHGVKIHLAHISTAFIGEGEMRRWQSPMVARRYGCAPVIRERFQREISEDLAADADLTATLDALEDGVYLFGHTHLQWQLASPDGRKLLLNPGSCGLPLDCIRGSLPYALLEIRPDGTWQAECLRVPYDVQQLAEAIRGSSQYREARVWSEVILRELYTAREHISFFLRDMEAYAVSIGDARRPYALDTWEAGYGRWAAENPSGDIEG